jgi:hypothetical protein
MKTCTVTISRNTSVTGSESPTFYYTDGTTQTIKSVTGTNIIITVPVNSIIAIEAWNATSSSSGLCNQLFYIADYAAYQINGDCTLIYNE